MPHIYKDTITPEELRTADAVIFMIEKQEVQAKNTERLDNLLRCALSVGRQAAGKLVVMINGYDGDARELYNIPEVVVYVSKIVNDAYLKKILYFFDRTSTPDTLKIWMLCLATDKYVLSSTVIPRGVTDQSVISSSLVDIELSDDYIQPFVGAILETAFLMGDATRTWQSISRELGID